MSDGMRHDRHGETTHFTHTHLWLAGQWALNRASDDAQITCEAGLLSLVSSALATEAILNYIGPKVCDSWSRSRAQLPPMRKLQTICEALGFHIDEEASDVAAFRQLFRLRNILAHARPETVSGSWRAADFPGDQRQEVEWMHYARASEAHQLTGLVHDLLERITRAAGESFGPFEQLNERMARPLSPPAA